MPSADQLRALVRSFVDRDDERFLAIAMQVAASEARRGHAKLADELRALVDEARRTKPAPRLRAAPATVQSSLDGLLSVSFPRTRLPDMVLAPEVRARLERVIVEVRQTEKLHAHGLTPRRKLLLVGPPGCGKTMTAAAFAGELSLPLMLVQLHAVMAKFLGETAAKLALVFDGMRATRGVYLFDEFDAIGADRRRDNDVGEIRRVLNAFLQFIESDTSDSLIIAATNNVEQLDHALFRRFDDVIEYRMPEGYQRLDAVRNALGVFDTSVLDWREVEKASEGLSYDEVTRAAFDAAKALVLGDHDALRTEDIIAALNDRGARPALR